MTETSEKSGIVYYSPAVRSWRDEGRFAVPGVAYRGRSMNILLFEQMTHSMTQGKLAELYETEKQKGNPHPTDMPLTWAIATRTHELRNENPEEAERLRSFLQTGFRKYPNTLSRVIYFPLGDDRIVHNYRTSDEYSTDAEVVGSNGWIKDIPDKGVLESLLGTNNIGQINSVSQWINGNDSYLWRLNSKPKEKVERIAGFDANADRLDLDCHRNPLSGYPAFRVLRVD